MFFLGTNTSQWPKYQYAQKLKAITKVKHLDANPNAHERFKIENIIHTFINM